MKYFDGLKEKLDILVCEFEVFCDFIDLLCKVSVVRNCGILFLYAELSKIYIFYITFCLI